MRCSCWATLSLSSLTSSVLQWSSAPNLLHSSLFESKDVCSILHCSWISVLLSLTPEKSFLTL